MSAITSGRADVAAAVVLDNLVRTFRAQGVAPRRSRRTAAAPAAPSGSGPAPSPADAGPPLDHARIAREARARVDARAAAEEEALYRRAWPAPAR